MNQLFTRQTKYNSSTESNDMKTEEQLIVAIKQGDEMAFEAIMRKYNQRLFRIARSILKDDDEAVDVVQDAYVTAYFKLDQYNGPSNFSSWISRIVSNEAMMRIRKSKRINYSIDSTDTSYDNMPSNEQQPLDHIASKQLRHLLEDAIDKLSVNYRCVYVMRAIQQLSTRETANSLDISEDLVKTRYSRAKKNLQKTFNQHIESTGLNVYEFLGERCDGIVATVLQRCFDKNSTH